MFKVHYYKHTKNFYQHFVTKEDEIHLTQSPSFAKYLNDQSGSNRVYGYKAFMSDLFPAWKNPHVEIFLKSKVRSFVHEHFPTLHEKQSERLMDEYMDAFLFLMNMGGLKLVSTEGLNVEQKALLKLQEDIVREKVVVDYFREMATLSPERLSEAFHRNERVTKIYIHHFDYIDAERMNLFHLFQRIGLEVVFCIPFHPSYPNVYKNWSGIYENILGVSKEDWICLEDAVPRNGAKFASYLDQNIKDTSRDSVNLDFHWFEHPISFKEYIKNNPIAENQNEIFAVFDENLNIYSSLTKNDSFFSSKFGQFFLSMQNCKKKSDGIHFTYDDFVNMLTSGWVESGGISGEQALNLLIDLRSYLEDVATFPELMDRFQALIAFQEMGDIFDEQGKEQAGRNRIKRYLSNPWRSFPVLHKSRYSITIKQLLECTKDLARKLNKLLIEEGEVVSVADYLETLKAVYASVNDSWPDELREKFEKLFHTPVNAGWEFGKQEIFSLISLYLGSRNEDQNVIRNFNQLAGMVMTTDHIHVTGLSFKTFPWKSPELPSLLSHTWLKKSIFNQYISTNRDIRLNSLLIDYYSRKVTRNTALYNIYHLLAFGNGKVTFSYIDGLVDKDGPSIYLSILQELYSIDKEDGEISDLEFEWEEPPASETKINKIDKDSLSKVPDLLWLDSDFCKKKFFLNAFIEQHPIYEQAFHQQQVFAIVGKLLAEQGEGREEVRESIYPLFPHWTNALKENLIETASAKGLREYKSYENVYYPKAMNRVQKLFSSNKVTENWKAKHQYENNSFNLESHLDEFAAAINESKVTAHSGRHCRMCPFLMSCKEGEYAVDAND
jgi:hypothetical protein